MIAKLKGTYTENLVAENTIRRSGKCGVLFRAERGKAFAGHRNELRGNSIIDSGGVDGVAVDVEGQTSDLRFIGNTLRETRAPASRVGFRFAAGTGTMTRASGDLATSVATPLTFARYPRMNSRGVSRKAGRLGLTRAR